MESIPILCSSCKFRHTDKVTQKRDAFDEWMQYHQQEAE